MSAQGVVTGDVAASLGRVASAAQTRTLSLTFEGVANAGHRLCECSLHGLSAGWRGSLPLARRALPLFGPAIRTCMASASAFAGVVWHVCAIHSFCQVCCFATAP